MGHGGAEIGGHKLLAVAGMTFNLDTLYMTWLTMAILVLGSLLIRMNWSLIPGGWQNFVELILEGLLGQIDATIGPNGRKVAPLLITLFLFLLIANWLGLVPGFTSPTNDINTTLGLALMIIALVHGYGIKTKGLLAHFKHFIEPNLFFLPINIIEELAKPVTLSFRLFGNILAGEILIVILGILVPYVAPTLWLAFSVFVGIIQALIFTMLSMSYLSNSLQEHHTGEKEG
ncbi:F0F1 ATP synthase subunit A [Sporomusa acidovorans]|uniref:ATP synthase subunit a n=1 Tax=Sporomusa acidovorans (strain ATCC 49682 / DSM 3132 / Mol) TaxID=1123286 RepID=A0ABZ3J9C2_SPOA4|nr:F0F1 ATP synthase subunit A [Sporomusa acidovorans]OZC16063.1 ATP synthase subunit a [Sporomusa acidovorans DSM 3132]SDD87894.1 ATP synthase F0 subcomplex A subunit [Sporomusa acidovorans]